MRLQEIDALVNVRCYFLRETNVHDGRLALYGDNLPEVQPGYHVHLGEKARAYVSTAVIAAIMIMPSTDKVRRNVMQHPLGTDVPMRPGHANVALYQVR